MSNRQNTWQQLYEAAVLETDDDKLNDRILAARHAMAARLHELGTNGNSAHTEQHEIANVLTSLRVLENERLRKLPRRTHQAGETATG
jgi:hypothetical protein